MSEGQEEPKTEKIVKGKDLTSYGQWLIEFCTEEIGVKPNFFGAFTHNLYLSWPLKNKGSKKELDRTAFLIFRDKLLDEGLEVEPVELGGKDSKFSKEFIWMYVTSNRKPLVKEPTTK